MKEKQNKAENLIIEKLKTKIGQATILNIKLDVFGFSRGAAIARRFIQPGSIIALLHTINAEYKIRCHIDIDFLGLFDTVLSDLILGWSYNIKLPKYIKSSTPCSGRRV